MKNSILCILKRSFLLTCILSLLSVSTYAMAAIYEPPKAPKVVFFKASQDEIVSGDTVTLSWLVQNASTVDILGMEKVVECQWPLIGKTEVQPTKTTTYVLTATGAGGKASASVTINVKEKTSPAVINSFTVSENEIFEGDSTTLAWDVADAVSVSIDSTKVEPKGTLIVTPDVTTTYVLQATGTDGKPVSKSVTVTVNKKTPAIIKSFTASEEEVAEGNKVTLTWQVADAVSVTLNDAKVAGEGTLELIPEDTTTYVLKAVGTDGVEVTQSVTVTVIPNPEVKSFTASATNVERGTLVTLKWDTENATSCEIITDDGLKLSNRPADGQVSITPNSTKTYTLIAYNAKNVTAKQSITITVQ